MAARPASEVIKHGARPTRNQRAQPGGEHPAARARKPGLRTGAERSGARGCVDADDSEDEALRAAGGPGSWSHDSMEAERSIIG
jgi:hypothetical protein